MDASTTNPPAFLGRNPRHGHVRPHGGADSGELWICEGLPDALTAAGLGHRSIAVLGAGLADRSMPAAIVAASPDRNVVIAFDDDDAGRLGAAHLTSSLDRASIASR